eukprot:Gregarina_sp_Pseudo_9__546@NODE_1351_length_1670_cov_13_120172_g1262_i0_p2_GENE_NODE_1351_length_1670_cov_13_120172_g1262_i0NODE_1351_length_1670_cov_13_120172_g1262_i0_p2_ORF_typecomplete_len113_score15_75_NODE_1351_length_1670_cov_13_120172_g1262_i0415753
MRDDFFCTSGTAFARVCRSVRQPAFRCLLVCRPRALTHTYTQAHTRSPVCLHTQAHTHAHTPVFVGCAPKGRRRRITAAYVFSSQPPGHDETLPDYFNEVLFVLLKVEEYHF